MKTSELTGAALDWAVARAEGAYAPSIHTDADGTCCVNYGGMFPEWSTDWTHGGPIIEREKIGVWWAPHVVDADGNEYGNCWYAETGLTEENADERHVCETGPTPLTAAMRCYVASKLGDEVEIPTELV